MGRSSMSKPIDYSSYLVLDKLLQAQTPISSGAGAIHDEHLFIITHQTYELWFKQIIHELDSIIQIFKSPEVKDNSLLMVLRRMERINMIMQLLIQHVPILETMTAMDFLDFRHLLYPASGFQSLQFRALEIKIGLKDSGRVTFDQKSYKEHLPKDLKNQLNALADSPTLFEGVCAWLERTPFLTTEQFSFWTEYRSAVEKMFREESQLVERNTNVSPEIKQRIRAQLTASQNSFSEIFNPERFNELRTAGQWSLSYPAVQASLFIQLYRDEPVLHLPFQILQSLLTLDERLSDWRQAHARMAKRMLGMKPGTGGSSGHQYLKETADRQKVFEDFYKLTTFFVRSNYRPQLPQSLREQLAFKYTGGQL